MKGYIKKQALMDYCSNQVTRTICNMELVKSMFVGEVEDGSK